MLREQPEGRLCDDWERLGCMAAFTSAVVPVTRSVSRFIVDCKAFTVVVTSVKATRVEDVANSCRRDSGMYKVGRVNSAAQAERDGSSFQTGARQRGSAASSAVGAADDVSVPERSFGISAGSDNWACMHQVRATNCRYVEKSRRATKRLKFLIDWCGPKE